jgi:hypothetical protein
VPGWGCGPLASDAAGVRLGTRWPASYGHPRCRESATCVPGPGHCEGPDGKRDRSSVPDCGWSSRGFRGSRADRIREGKKRFCCVTTRRRNRRVDNGLGRGLGALAACVLCLGVLSLGGGILAMSGLPPCGLPTADLPPAFRILAVALVPTSRLVSLSASLAQADSRTRPAPSGRKAVLSLNVRGAHGRCHLPRGKLGEDASTFSPSAIETRTKRLPAS